jgi:hypothetical protein
LRIRRRNARLHEDRSRRYKSPTIYCVKQKKMLYLLHSQKQPLPDRGVNALQTLCLEPETMPDFLIWIRRNPLKSPDSDE